MTTLKEHKQINAYLADGWYVEGEPRENPAIEDALNFIVSSPYDEDAMIRARDQIVEALEGPVEDRVSGMEAGEKALLAAHVAGLLYIREEASAEAIDGINSRVDTVVEGDYLYEYGDDTHETKSMPITMGDDFADDLRRQLRARGLDWETDDTGWLVVEVPS